MVMGFWILSLLYHSYSSLNCQFEGYYPLKHVLLYNKTILVYFLCTVVRICKEYLILWQKCDGFFYSRLIYPFAQNIVELENNEYDL